MRDELPDYIEARIRQNPVCSSIVPGSTPVIAFGDARRARVATLGWNPSRIEFLTQDGQELAGNARRLETFSSLGIKNLNRADSDVIRRVFDGSNNYFHRCPYRWFNKLDSILTAANCSYKDGTACHLDLVQWSTDPTWRSLSRPERKQLLDADLPFLIELLSREKIQLLLLNGMGIIKACEEYLSGKFALCSLRDAGRLKIFSGTIQPKINAIGWNLNLQSSFGVTSEEINKIASAVSECAVQLLSK
jgi:hypothetical protein